MFSIGSRELQHWGKERQLLCVDCRNHAKKFGGELPQVNTSSSGSGANGAPYLFRPVQNESTDDSPGRMRTRTRSNQQNPRSRPKRGSGTDTPESEMDKKGCKSPASNASSPSDKNKRKVYIMIDKMISKIE